MPLDIEDGPQSGFRLAASSPELGDQVAERDDARVKTFRVVALEILERKVRHALTDAFAPIGQLRAAR